MKLSHNKKTYNFSLTCTIKWPQLGKKIFCLIKSCLLLSAAITALIFYLSWGDIYTTQVWRNATVPLIPEESAERLCNLDPLLLESQIKLKVEWNEGLFLLWIKIGGSSPKKTPFRTKPQSLESQTSKVHLA